MATRRRCRACCSLPNGWLSLVVAISATFGTIFSLASLTDCRFTTSDYIFYDHWESRISINRGFGLLNYEKYENSCQPYNNGWGAGFPEGWPLDLMTEDLGPVHLTARAFGIIAAVVGCISMIISWIMCCAACDVRFIKGLGIVYGFNMIFQSLVMIFFGSELCLDYKASYTCSFGSSAGLAVVAIILWAFASLLCFKMSPPVEDLAGVVPIPAPSSTQIKHVKVTEIISKDGEKTVTRETIEPDGSKLVETTITHIEGNGHADLEQGQN